MLLLVDGQEVLGRIGGDVDLGNLLAHDIERIEIVKGAGSALYGSDALGGVVNILTRTASRPLELTFGQRVESLDGRATEASAGFKSGPWTASASGGRLTREAYDLTPEEPTTTGSEFRQLGGSARAGYRLAPRSDITFSFRHYDEDAADVSTSRGTVYDDLVFDQRSQVIAELRAGLTATGTLTARGHLSRYTHDFERVNRTTGAATPDLTRERLGEIELQYDQPFGRRHLLSLGAELEEAQMSSDRIAGSERDITTGVGFVQDEWFATDRLRLVAGVRYDRSSAYGSAWSPKLGALVRLAPAVRFRASFGEGFKAPGFKDLYFQFGNRQAGYQVVGNPDLRPETSRTLSAGIEADAWDGRLRLSATAFHNRIDDLIESVFASQDATSGILTYRSQNIDAVRTRGTELDLSLSPKPWMRLGLAHAWLEAIDRDTGEPLPLRPRHTLKARAMAQWKKTSVALFGRYIGERAFADTDRDGRIDDWAPASVVFDARVAQELGRSLQLVLGAENAFDEQDPRYFPVAGRRVYAGLVVRYDRD